MRYAIIKNKTKLAECDQQQLADAILDILLGEAKDGDTFEILDGTTVIVAFDENGNQTIGN